jgi:hypothetical protein
MLRHSCFSNYIIVLLLLFGLRAEAYNAFLGTPVDSSKQFIPIELVVDRVAKAGSEIEVSLLQDTTKCLKYKKEHRTLVVSSTRGQLSDTGWEDLGEVDIACQVIPPDGQQCTSETIPGASLGDDDETITTCNYDRYTCLKKYEKCKASDQTQTFSVELPNWTPLKNTAAQAAKTMPMISEFSIDVKGMVTRETGEKCCLADVTQPSVAYQKYSGTVSGSITVKLNIPGWHWEFVKVWQGLFRIRAIVKLGPTVTVSPQATVSVAGTLSDNCSPACECCITTSYSATVGLEVAFGGEIEASITLYFWPHTRFHAQAYAKASLSSTIGSSGTYNGKGCPIEGFSGKVSCGELVGTAQFGLVFRGYNISYSWAYTLLPGGSVSF